MTQTKKQVEKIEENKLELIIGRFQIGLGIVTYLVTIGGLFFILPDVFLCGMVFVIGIITGSVILASGLTHLDNWKEAQKQNDA